MKESENNLYESKLKNVKRIGKRYDLIAAKIKEKN